MIQQDKKWKPPVFTYVLLFIFALYLSLVLAATYHVGDSIYAFAPRLTKLFKDTPFTFSYISALRNTKVFLVSLLLLGTVVGLYIVMDMAKIRDFMAGKEYGTASWADIDKLNKKFADYTKEKDKETNKKKYVYTKANRVYSDKLRISMDGKATGINNNVLVIGGSGVGKSFKLLTPNIYQADPESRYPGSYIFTDPKGELLLKNGAYLRSVGYKVKVLNLVPGKMKESDRFNPFCYIRSQADIRKWITNLQKNSTEKNTSSSDPFWPKAEALYLEALFLIVWMEHDRFGWPMTMGTVLDLMAKCEVNDDGTPSPLDNIFEELVYQTSGIPGQGIEHPAYVAYHKVMGGAADTVRSVKITADVRMSIFNEPDLRRVLSDDDMDLASIGTGKVDGRENVKTALFCVIPDSDTTYNCVAGMMYTLLFQELYYQADFIYDGELPVPVSFWLDEFANIALPDNFMNMLTTMRSRLISCVILIQNLAQIKAMFKDTWEKIPGNCDVCVYLGGNEQSTFKYISENLGKKTIHKKSSGESLGKNRSSSTNTDTLGRELMLPDEVRELDNDYCIVFVRGKKPVFDKKFDTLHSADFAISKELGLYDHEKAREHDKAIRIKEISRQEAMEAEDRVININLDEDFEQSVPFAELEAIAVKNQKDEEAERERVVNIDISGWTLDQILSYPDFELTADEINEVTAGVDDGLSDEEIKSYILYEDAERMRAQRLLINLMHKREQEAG